VRLSVNFISRTVIYNLSGLSTILHSLVIARLLLLIVITTLLLLFLIIKAHVTQAGFLQYKPARVTCLKGAYSICRLFLATW